MNDKESFLPALFSIGQTCNMCGVTPRTLRYYESIGLIRPDHVRESSGYRYYSLETMERVQTIRYYHEEGFSLETIRKMLETGSYLEYLDHYRRQIRKTQEAIEEQRKKLYHLEACHALLEETKEVIDKQQTDITIRHIPKAESLQYVFRADPESDLVQQHTDGYLSFLWEGLGDLSMVDLVGGYSIMFPSLKDRLRNAPQNITLIQPVYPSLPEGSETSEFGGFDALSCNHVGSLNDITKTYERMMAHADKRDLALQGYAIERPLWWDLSPDRSDALAMELILPLK